MNETILLIEDNVHMRENTAEILELADYKVLTAKNGKEGLDLLRKSQPDLVLCDVMMPGLDGYGVLHEIENMKEAFAMPFVFISALSEKDHVRMGMIQGADDYISKPFSNEELLKVVSVRLKKARSIKEPLKNNQQGLDAIVDINYAQKVYNAFLTKEEEIKNDFPESFLIYKAQEIISGDFYFLNRSGDKSIIVLGDSTGHGLSASYISISMLNILSRIIREGEDNPAKILQTVNDEMHHYTNSDKNTELIESADTIVCSFDHNSRKLHYSSARINGAIIRNGEVTELKKDDFSIGDHTMRTFTSTDHFIQLEKGDCLYLFSDGMGDQFGGPENKRFGHKQFIKMLAENHTFAMLDQKQNILDALSVGQGKKDQTDDVTLLGFRIN